MMFRKIILLVILRTVFSYHFYNPTTHHVLTQSSLKNIPPGYRFLAPPKSHRSLSKGKRNGYCTDAGFICSAPFSKSLTFQFECDEDHQCPKTYKCCQQKCFLHKICSKATFPRTNANGNLNGNSCRPGYCEKWPYNCQKPYDYEVTSIFKCSNDRQCPKNFKCCEQSCFVHKICSRAVTSAKNITAYNRKTEMKEDLIRKSDWITGIFDNDGNAPGEDIEAEPSLPTEFYMEVEEATEAEEDTEVTEAREDTEITENTEATEVTEAKEEMEATEVTEAMEETEATEPTEVIELQTELGEESSLIEDKNQLTVVTSEIAVTDSKSDRESNFSTTISNPNEQNMITSSSLKSTPDVNSINPEYAAYYYHYGEGNDTYDEYDYDDETEED